MTTRRSELNADDVRELLSDLDARLRAQGASAAIFVVGGAAIAVAGIRSGRLTVDVDALTLKRRRDLRGSGNGSGSRTP